MSQWDELMQGKLFITDLGENRHAEIDGMDTVVGRYAVWAPIRNADRHQIIEVGCELLPLAEKYHIPHERICTIGQGGESKCKSN